jgi:electron transfer flavoprotein alpha subunit
VLVVDDPKVKDMLSGPIVDALAAAVQESGAKAVFLHGGRRGKEIAPRLGAKLKAGVVTLANKVKSEGGKLSFERMFLGGKTVATEIPASDLVVATFPARLFEPLPADAARKGEVKKLSATRRSRSSRRSPARTRASTSKPPPPSSARAAASRRRTTSSSPSTSPRPSADRSAAAGPSRRTWAGSATSTGSASPARRSSPRSTSRPASAARSSTRRASATRSSSSR